MDTPPLTPPLRKALDVVYDYLVFLEVEARSMDREARLKWISERIAGRTYARQGIPPTDDPNNVGLAAAECIFALSLLFGP